MASVVQDAIKRVSTSGYDERLAHVQGTYRFEIEGVGQFLLKVDRGKVQISEGAGKADCVIGCSEEDFARIITGQQNLLTAYLRGRVRFEGDAALAFVFHGLRPGPRPQAEVEGRAP